MLRIEDLTAADVVAGVIHKKAGYGKLLIPAGLMAGFYAMLKGGKGKMDQYQKDVKEGNYSGGSGAGQLGNALTTNAVAATKVNEENGG